MVKLKRLLPADKDAVQIDVPVSEEELLDRQLQYPLLQPNKFAKRYHKHLFEPVSFQWKGKEYTVQVNHCNNPFCESFGITQERFETIKHKPYRYKLQGSKNRNGTKAMLCNPIPIPTKIPKTSLGCSTYTVSNWSVVEEIKRLIELQTVEDIEPHYVFHREGCSMDGVTPFDEPSKFHLKGRSTGNSTKYQCKECKKNTNVLPTKRQSTTYHQKRNDVLPTFSKLLLSKTPVKRTCEILNMGNKTYYSKLKWLYRCCLEFLEKHETKGFQRISFDELWINSDKMQYYLNNVRQKGKGGTHYSDIEEKLLQTHIVISADIKSRYVFRSDIAFDWNFTLKQLEEETLWYRDDHVDSFCRKNDRLRFSYYPQEPSEVDIHIHTEHIEELHKIKQREKYIEGLHVKSNYTALAHFWMIKQLVQAKEWRFVTDEDYSLINGIYKMFSDDFRLYNAHYFVTKIDKAKSRKQAYEEHIEAKKFLQSWGADKKVTNVAQAYLAEQLKTHQFCKEVQLSDKKVMAYLNNPIEHPLPSIDKGTMTVDCRTDISAYELNQLASMILKVNDHATNSFIQQIRRRISILERPLLTARGDGKSYIYANFNPEYAQYAITILRTFYNFCYTDKKGKTPAQRIGITNKAFNANDILYRT